MEYQYVTHNPKGGWDVKGAGAQRATKHFERQADAYAYAKRIAENHSGAVRQQRRNGTFGVESTFGKDPRESKG